MAGEKTDRADEFTGTRYANPFNSTPFTDCWPVSGVCRG